MNSAEEREADDMKMKRFETMSDCSLFAYATEDELFVSQILLGLENLAPLPIFLWGCRKRRSYPVADSSDPPSAQIAEKEIEVRSPLAKAKEKEEDAAAAANTTTSSPTTPLSFSPSESDGKSKHSSKKTSKKRSRAEFSDIIEGLTRHGDLLRMKVENVREQFNKLKGQNSDLKAMKQEALKTCQRREEEPQMGRFLNLGMDFIQHDETIMLTHQQPFIADPTVHKLHHPFGPIQVYPPNNGLESVNLLGSPVEIPDLNLTAEEALGVGSSQDFGVGSSHEITDKRSRFAEARRMRKEIIKTKSTRSACGIKLPRT